MALFVAAVALRVLGNVPVIDLDLFHEMALIREALKLGSLPTEDVFAYTPTVSPSVHHEWGTGAILYLVTVALGGGLPGLSLLRLLLLVAISLSVVAVARHRGATRTSLIPLAPLAIILFWPGLSPVRAHLFTFTFLGLLLLLLEWDRGGGRRWIPIWLGLFVVWVNLHGGFVVGLGMLGLYTLERFIRTGSQEGWPETWSAHGHLVLAISLSIPLVVVNPYGVNLPIYLWHALLMDRPMIMEWSPIWSEDFRSVALPLFIASLLILAYTVIRRRGWRQPGILMVLVAAVVAARSVRILPIYSVLWLAYVAPALEASPVGPLLKRAWVRHSRLVGGACLLIAVPLLVQAIQSKPWSLQIPTESGVHQPHYPVGAVEYLSQAGFAGNLMTPFRVGAFVSWYLYPDVLVGLDSRYEVAYPPEFVEEAIRIYNGQGDWEGFMSRHPTDAILVPVGGPLDSLLVAETLNSDPHWTQVYRDDGFAIFANPSTASTLPRQDRRGVSITPHFP